MICIRKSDSAPALPLSADKRGEGFALVSVLLFLLVVTAVITPFVLAARTDFVLASGEYRNGKQDHLADGIVRLFARQIASSAIVVNEALQLNSIPMSSICGDQQIEVRIQDQLSLVNLNVAPADLLMAGFSAIDLPEADPAELAAFVETYRSQQGPGSSDGGEKLLDGFKFSAFEAVEELYEFPGIAKLPVRRLTEVFTVHGGSATVNPDNLPPGLAEELSGGPAPNPPTTGDSVEQSLFYRIEVQIRSTASGAYGYSGMLIEIAGGEKTNYAGLERTAKPNVVGGDQDDIVPNMPCEQLLGVEVAEWLAPK